MPGRCTSVMSVNCTSGATPLDSNAVLVAIFTPQASDVAAGTQVAAFPARRHLVSARLWLGTGGEPDGRRGRSCRHRGAMRERWLDAPTGGKLNFREKVCTLNSIGATCAAGKLTTVVITCHTLNIDITDCHTKGKAPYWRC